MCLWIDTETHDLQNASGAKDGGSVSLDYIYEVILIDCILIVMLNIKIREKKS